MQFLAEQKQSGLSLRAFAKAKGVKSSTFNSWKAKQLKAQKNGLVNITDEVKTYVPSIGLKPEETVILKKHGFEIQISSSLLLQILKTL